MVPQLWLSGLSSLNRRRIENKKTITSTTQKRRTDCENTNSGSDGWLEKLMLPLPLLCLFRSVQHSLLLVEDTFLCTSQPVRHHTTALKWYSAPLRSNTLMGLFYKFYTQSPLAQEKDDFFTLMVRLWWWWIFFASILTVLNQENVKTLTATPAQWAGFTRFILLQIEKGSRFIRKRPIPRT